LIQLTIGFVTIAIAAAANCPKMTVRKEMNDLTEAEWKIYLNTIEKATTTIDPETGNTIWEAGMVKHHSIPGLHGGPMFGFAHRYFLVWFERKLQTINPDFAFFYWNSGNEFNKWTKSKIWNYLGEQHGPINIKAFIGKTFKTLNGKNFERKCTTSENPPPSQFFNGIWENTKHQGYSSFCKKIEAAHGVLHNLIGGLMTQLHYSAFDPLFYAHHCHIDYLILQAQLKWADQKFPLSSSYGPELKLDTPMAGFPDVTIGDVLDVADICVSYDVSKPPVTPVTPVVTPGIVNVTGGGNVSNVTGGGNVSNVTNVTNVPVDGTTDLKNFTLKLTDEWVESSFGNNSEEIVKEAEKMRDDFDKQVDTGSVIVTTVLDDKKRAYVGAKPGGEKNLKRLTNGASSIGFRALVLYTSS